MLDAILLMLKLGLRKIPLPSRQTGYIRLPFPTREPLTYGVDRTQSHEVVGSVEGRWEAQAVEAELVSVPTSKITSTDTILRYWAIKLK